MAYVRDPFEKLVVQKKKMWLQWVLYLSLQYGQWIYCFDRCQLTITWMSNIKDVCFRPKRHVILHSVIIIIVLVCTFPQAIPLAIFTMNKAIYIWIWDSMNGVRFGGPLDCRSFVMNAILSNNLFLLHLRESKNMRKRADIPFLVYRISDSVVSYCFQIWWGNIKDWRAKKTFCCTNTCTWWPSWRWYLSFDYFQ